MTTDQATLRARELVGRMTLEEVVSQLSTEAQAIPRLGLPMYGWWNEALHGVARAGAATVFPQAIGLAAMFDEERQKKVGEIIATEGRAKYNMYRAANERGCTRGVTYWSPNVNIFRDPRWGRGHETYGEDPFLTSRLGVAFVKGVQGDGKYLKGAACAKHFCVHSGPEPIRHEFNAVASKKDMAETYLPAFEALVKEAKVEAVMGAYNRVNGEACCGSSALLTDLLRKKWGFTGHVVSDCLAVQDMHLHHKVTNTDTESAALAIKSGCDINCGNMYKRLMLSWQEGLVTEEEIREACVHAMATRFRLGMFDDDCEYDQIPYSVNECPEHGKEALEDARRSMVLLKNDGILPIDPKKVNTVAVIGPNSDSVACLEGNYNGTASEYVTFVEGVRRVLGEDKRILHCRGCHLYKGESVSAEAVAMAKASDVVLLCLGLDATLEGEEGDAYNAFAGGDKVNLELPAVQQLLLRKIVETGKPVVVLLAAGSALNVNLGNAVLDTWYPGQSGGLAAAEIVFGKVSPSGKLPLTFYEKIEDCPPFTDYSMKERTYRYFTGKPRYPFGYGMSYAEFEYSDAKLEGDLISAAVKNVSAVEAEEVAQVYVRVKGSKWAPVNHSLCGFKRVHLKPGESCRVEIRVPERAFMVVNDDGEFVKDGTGYTFFIGGGQPDERTFELTGKKPLAIEI